MADIPIPGLNLDPEQRSAMLALLADLRYPAGPRGDNLALIDGMPYRPDDPNILDSMKGVIAYHLTMAGWRPDLSKRKRKARRVYGAGMFADAVVWVGVDEPDDPLADLANMTMAQIDALEPEDVRYEARRRLGLPAPPAAPTPEPWQQPPHVEITDADDEEEET